ncbi:hypothetical protein H2199_000307 [Coniosporium tulheliwenetii]|uniref:Uncharacterized protein n=1 Tax=Coniosporium tulheliwenetii TaxID=3383036 RepID=A0ACC2ZPM2_9PEZI|nr:hypothetical protein H2199_000307 [Cladosporium sp. JES 115]
MPPMPRLLSASKDVLIPDDAGSRSNASHAWNPAADKDASTASTTSSRSSLYSVRSMTDSMLSRRSSTTSYTGSSVYSANMEIVPTLTRTPWELERNKRPWSQHSRRSRPASVLSARVFRELPSEIYSCISQQLEALHFQSPVNSCATCYLRDLQNLALTSRAWEKAARQQLYGSIRLPADKLDAESKKSKNKTANRIKILRRTLRERSGLAKLVREIHVPELQRIYQQSVPQERSQLIDSLASLVMACPNLEKLVGFYPTYEHEFDRLTYALSTRRSLKERAWVIRNTKRRDSGCFDGKEEEVYYASYSDPVEMFLQQHESWLNLQTLVLHAQNTGTMNFRAFIATFRQLPNLKDLHISSFGSDEFNDRTLLALPPLRSLRLQDLHGLTDRGLLRFAGSDAAKGLRKLSLIDLEIMLLSVITKFLSTAENLKRFTVVQDGSPGLPPGAIMRTPALSSKSIEFLHWDILVPGSANEDLASSIAAGGFPSLRIIRAPSDHDGLLQNLCRPVAQITQDSDHHLLSQLGGAKLSSFTRYLRTLPAARRAAQKRIEEARRRPAVKIVVECDGVVQNTHTIRSYVGTLGSKIEYWLEPDVPGSEDAVAGIADLLRGGAASWSGNNDVCMGGGKGEASAEAAGWFHAPRQRCASIGLETLF